MHKTFGRRRFLPQLRPVAAYLLGALLLAGCAAGEVPQVSDTGRGHLVVVGGGPRPESVMSRFIELAGGPGEARIAIFPTSSSEPVETGEGLIEEMLALGAVEAVSFPITREEATEEVAATLEGFTGIWFAGGSQRRHTGILKGTPVEDAVHRFYQEGGVIGGTSAGAAIMSEMMITGQEERPGGDRPSRESYITIDRENIVTEPGIGFLDDLIIDQHFIRRKRHNRLISLVLENPELLGAGIDEETAIVVRPDGLWEIVGNSTVVVYDARDARVTGPDEPVLGAEGMRLHILTPGTVFDPKAR